MLFRFTYNLVMNLSYPLLRIIGILSHKLYLFTTGRQEVFKQIVIREVNIGEWVWFHVASLGELEQARPVMEELKKSFSNHKILLTFFSPSGYEVQKHYNLADCVCYLPWDTNRNVNRFLNFCNIKLALFIKYEFWPNYFYGLSKRKIPTYSVSSIFRPEQIFFSWYGGAFRNILLDINHFFVQNESSKSLLNSIGIDQVTVNADTRVDRVYKMSRQNNKLELMEDFTAGKKCFVAGSTWPEDYDIMEHLFEKETRLKVVIAPHEVDQKSIEKLEKHISVDCAKWSSYSSEKDRNKSILIVDNIGQLGKLYSYASFAYVGGGMKKNGLHNTLEPAAYGIPIIIGEHYNRYEEAVTLLNSGGMISVKSSAEFKEITHKLIKDKKLTQQMGENNNQYILSKKGASQLILKKIESLSGL
ncbi:MAG: 3-deoxy-D-manno-octulosonic acid transferase [Flavobacteriaceae bacterium]|nr:3-deoxy-D-manno-octulosonic acid transferase [Flavobacteriaceae bacterium]